MQESILIGVILMASSFIQSVAGFGFALFALPVLVVIGLSLPEAILLLNITSFFQASCSSIKLRHSIPWAEVKLSIFWRLIFIPIGVFLMADVAGLPDVEIKAVIGWAILFVVFARKWLKLERNNSPYLAGFLFSLSGLMAGALGIGGPALVIWVTSQKWSAEKSRAFLLTNFSIGTPIAVVMILFKFSGQLPLQAIMWQCLIVLPFLLAGSVLGMKVAQSISNQLFQKTVFFLLVVMAGGLIFRF